MKETQTMKILRDLEAGKRLTQLYATQEYGCTRLGARIYDLKKAGYPIQSKMITVKTRNGEASVKQYWLEGR